jgi:hypothetical protein
VSVETHTCTVDPGVPFLVNTEGKFNSFSAMVSRLTGYGGTCQVHISPMINNRVITNIKWDIWAAATRSMEVRVPFAVNGLTMTSSGGTVMAKLNLNIDDELEMAEPPTAAEPARPVVPQFGADMADLERRRREEAEMRAIIAEDERLKSLERKAKRAKKTVAKKKADRKRKMALAGTRRVRELEEDE